MIEQAKKYWVLCLTRNLIHSFKALETKPAISDCGSPTAFMLHEEKLQRLAKQSRSTGEGETPGTDKVKQPEVNNQESH